MPTAAPLKSSNAPFDDSFKQDTGAWLSVSGSAFERLCLVAPQIIAATLMPFNLASVEQVVQKPPYLVLKFYVVLKSIRDAINHFLECEEVVDVCPKQVVDLCPKHMRDSGLKIHACLPVVFQSIADLPSKGREWPATSRSMAKKGSLLVSLRVCLFGLD